MTSQRILVTGAAGGLGRALCCLLLSRGFAVRACVRSPDSAARLPPNVDIGWVGDIGHHTKWARELFVGVDAVVHLAAKVHCRGDVDDEFTALNVLATQTLIRAAATYEVPRFVYCSSVHAVGNFSEETFDESTPCRPQTPYGISKSAAEQVVRAVAAATGIEVVIIRPVPIYGPELAGDLMRILKLLSRGWPLPIGALHGRRSFVFLENVADALAAAAIHPAAGGETFFVSDGYDVSLSELATVFAQATGIRTRTFAVSPATLRWLAGAVGMKTAGRRLLGSLSVDSRRIRRVLDWNQPHSFSDALRLTGDWLRRAA